ncbi:uncharacterized protein LOC102802985 [Saccoglossus kowalevskii]|uniref:Tripartite motif-containing protein 2-like n=1 Tax=Saccoglossus kowalevskii TaxID=10224 RepID=A0ABM0MNK5_SACKO|nr:PREDICTED: tripartite motif-containing protein 2-like [Saccoglossus kowalevskii]
MATEWSEASHDIKQMVTCSICYDIYKKAKMLPCQHSFCEQCLEKWFNVCGGFNLVCPNCNQNTPVNRVQELPLSLAINELVDLVGISTRRISQTVQKKRRCHHSKRVYLLYSLFFATLSVLVYNVNYICGPINNSCSNTPNHAHLLKVKYEELQQNKTNTLNRLKHVRLRRAEQEKQIREHARETTKRIIEMIKQDELGYLDNLNAYYDELKEDIHQEIRHYDVTQEILTVAMSFTNKLETMKTAIGTDLVCQIHNMTSSLDVQWFSKSALLPELYIGHIALNGSFGDITN